METTGAAQTPSTSTYISHQGYQTTLLDFDQVIKETELKYDEKSNCNYRCLGQLSWLEDSEFASHESRVYFIDQTVNHVKANIPSRETLITIVSLGSGYLLTEFYIINLLNDLGYKNIETRIIDTAYKNDGCKRCIKEFKEKTNSNVRAFTTEQAYLNSDFAENDKKRGAIVILSIYPPRQIDPSIKEKRPDCMSLKVMSVDKIQGANGICLIFGRTNEKIKLYKILKNLSAGEQDCIINFALTCSINKQGGYEISFSPSERGKFINDGVKPYLESLTRESNSKKINLSDIEKVLEEYLKDLKSQGVAGIKFYFSEYDKSIIKLHDYFDDGNGQTLFASFDKNKISFEKKVEKKNSLSL
jgi:hypothetical protein